MPERVRKVFKDSDDEENTIAAPLVQSKSPKKRKAAEAFPAPEKFLEKHRRAGIERPAKTVDFTERQTKSSPSTASLQSRSGNLKSRAKQLLLSRQKLPIWSHAAEIKEKTKKNDVVLLVGETGSGKSTQVPQFLVDESWCRMKTLPNGTKVGGSVAITQPRRMAAISLARRVAEEMGTPLGSSSPASQVGYSVRFDNNTSPATRIKFLTDGMLLQELLRDPWMREYSVVIVDEVHERGANVDLVLGFLKKIVEGRNENDGRGGMPLKVIVMSATADMEKIRDFFDAKQEPQTDTGRASAPSIEGEPQVTDDFLGFSDQEDKPVAVAKPASQTTSCHIKGRQFPVTITYTPQPVANALDAAMERIIHIHLHTPLPGDVLVFLTGQETVEALESLCQTYAENLQTQSKQKGAPRLPHLQILPLFAALPTHLQQRVFESTPPFTRKIILSTNIAETSVTVPGVRHVIDVGKRKARHFRPSLNLDTLLTTAISRSSANQRSGRAGREAPGTCHRLYTQQDFYKLAADTEPEILRCDLSQLVLTLKAHDVDDILSFPLLTAPPRRSLERALLHLLQLNALDPRSGQITPLGRRMNALPLPADLSRVLLASSSPRYDCVDEIIDIVSALSVENIWLPTHRGSNKNAATSDGNDHLDPHDSDPESPSNDPVETARRTLHRREGDHLTLLAAIQSFAAETADRKAWCRRHAVSHRAMTAAMDVRKQLTRTMASHAKRKQKKPDDETEDPTTSRPGGDDRSSSSSSELLPTRVLRCLLTGLHPNVARITSSTSSSAKPKPSSSSSGAATLPGSQYKTLLTSQPLSLHPSSVLFARRPGPAAIVYSEFVYTNRAYARVCSAVEMGWVEQAAEE